jgi:hypothetical protein
MVTRSAIRPAGRPGWGQPDAIDDYLKFREELREALRECTPAALRRVVRRWAGPRDGQLGALVAQPDGMLEPIIRKMILEESHLSDMHDEARKWLMAHEDTPIPFRHIAPTDARRMARPRSDLN